MKVCILGGAGYIGSKLYDYLNYPGHVNYQGHVISSYDLEWYGNYGTPSVVRDFNDLSAAELAYYDAVILLAGHSSVQMCDKNRSGTFNNNVRNFVNLLGKLDKQKFIYASSSSLYAGQPGQAVEDESSYIPTNYYDLSKKEIDLYAALSGLDYYGLRFGTVNGLSMNLRDDLMINKMYLTAKETGMINIYNANVRRPILGINDLCRAVEAILAGGKNPGIYNVASFNETVYNIALAVAAETGATIVDKGSSPTYDFHISTEKFRNTYNFTFTETASSIVKSLAQADGQWTRTSRGSAKPYA